MKKNIFIMLAVMLAVFMTLPALADRKGHGSYHERPAHDRDDGHGEPRHYDNRDRDGDRDRQRDRDHGREYDYRKPGNHPYGYRNQPHGRHYGDPHTSKGRSYRYDGHWISYDTWERYRKIPPISIGQKAKV